MRAALLSPNLRALTPDLADGVAFILAALREVIARHFRNPRMALYVVPLCAYLSRVARRFARLMAQANAGQPARQHPKRERASRPRPASQFPLKFGWLLAELRHEAGAHGAQLRHILSKPGIAELLAELPAAARLLNPIRRLLGQRPLRPPTPPAPKPEPHAAPAPASPPQIEKPA